MGRQAQRIRKFRWLNPLGGASQYYLCGHDRGPSAGRCAHREGAAAPSFEEGDCDRRQAPLCPRRRAPGGPYECAGRGPRWRGRRAGPGADDAASEVVGANAGGRPGHPDEPGVPGSRRPPGAGEEHRQGAARRGRTGPVHGPGPAGELRVGARPAWHRPAPGLSPQPQRGNHDGGVITFGPDGKLYILVGDGGRRGQLQNLPDGPFGPGQPDDQFGGPQPDDAHLTGVILRLNDDGTTPADNPFFGAGAEIGGQVGANIQKVFAYGLRNSFGMAFDPISGQLWEEENGDDSFTELNRVEPGFNSGWVQIQGPPDRIGQYKSIETSFDVDPVTGTAYFGLQQVRWPPTNIADSSAEALSRLFKLPGASYSAPEFSWKFEVAPAAIGFVDGRALGAQFEGDLFVGAARTFLEGGNLFRFNLTGNRRKVAVDDPRLEDRVADNHNKFDVTESESLLIGTNFGIVTDIETGPNGHLFVVSLSQGAIHEIARR